MLSDRPRHRESAADASFPVRLRGFPGARVQPSRRKALGELPGRLRLARRCSTKRKRLMTACQPRGLPRTWTPARRWGQGWCARSPLATVTAHGQRSEVCRARRHRVHRQRAYCYHHRWPTGRCRRSNPARRCVSRDGPHLAEHFVKHPVKHCETHRQSVTKHRQPPLPGAPTDPLPTARPHARYPVRPPGYCRGHEPLSRSARRVRLDGLRPHRPMRCRRFREESAAPWHCCRRSSPPMMR